MSHEPGSPKSECQETKGPTSERLTIVLKKIYNITNKNKIKALFNNVTRKMDTMHKSDWSAPRTHGRQNTMQKFCR